MAVSAILSTPAYPLSPSNRVDVVLKSFKSPLYGQTVLHSSLVGRDLGSFSGGRSVIVSVFQVGRRAKEIKTVIPDPDFRIPIVLLGLAGGLVYTNNIVTAAPVGLLGLLLLVQATRVRFVFDKEALEVKVGNGLKESGENVFVGGKNRWKYSSFVNWEFWWPNFPILVYFKETQTKPEGQIHFFPIIFNGKQLYDIMVERAGPSKTSAPKKS